MTFGRGVALPLVVRHNTHTHKHTRGGKMQIYVPFLLCNEISDCGNDLHSPLATETARQFCSVHKTNLHLKPQQLKSAAAEAATSLPHATHTRTLTRIAGGSVSCVLGATSSPWTTLSHAAAAEWSVNEIFMQHQTYHKMQEASVVC